MSHPTRYLCIAVCIVGGIAIEPLRWWALGAAVGMCGSGCLLTFTAQPRKERERG